MVLHKQNQVSSIMIRDQCTRLTRFTRFTKLLSNYQITIQDLQGQITIKLQKTMRIHTLLKTKMIEQFSRNIRDEKHQ